MSAHGSSRPRVGGARRPPPSRRSAARARRSARAGSTCRSRSGPTTPATVPGRDGERDAVQHHAGRRTASSPPRARSGSRPHHHRLASLRWHDPDQVRGSARRRALSAPVGTPRQTFRTEVYVLHSRRWRARCNGSAASRWCPTAAWARCCRRRCVRARCAEEANLIAPEQVVALHVAFIRAGADVIHTNTYGANPVKLAAHKLDDRFEAVNQAGVKLAREAREVAGPRRARGGVDRPARDGAGRARARGDGRARSPPRPARSRAAGSTCSCSRRSRRSRSCWRRSGRCAR